MKLTADQARLIIQTEEFMLSEGSGPDISSLLAEIRREWPYLVLEFPGITWPEPAPEMAKPYVFELTLDQTAVVRAWMDSRPDAPGGAIGGRFTFMFCETSIGTIEKVRDDVDGSELDVTEYDTW